MKKILPALFLAALVFARLCAGAAERFCLGRHRPDPARSAHPKLAARFRKAFQHFLFTDATRFRFLPADPTADLHARLRRVRFSPGRLSLTSILCHVAAALALLLSRDELLRLVRTSRNGNGGASRSSPRSPGRSIRCTPPPSLTFPGGPIRWRRRSDFSASIARSAALRATGAKRWILLVAAGALFLLSALSKETGLVFPALVGARFLLLKKKWTEFLPATVVVAFRGGDLSQPAPAGRACAAAHASPARAPARQADRGRPRLRRICRPDSASRSISTWIGMSRRIRRDEARRATNSAAWRELQTLLGILLAAGAVYWLIRSRKQDPAIFACLVLAAHRLSARQRHFLAECDRRRALALSAGRVSFPRRGPGDFAIFNFPRSSSDRLLAVWFVFLGRADLDPNLRLERSAHLPRTHDRERRRFRPNADQPRRARAAVRDNSIPPKSIWRWRCARSRTSPWPS